jgi:hypothetical protein
MWRGALFCTDGKPTMALERRVASYGTLKVRSDTDGHWHASFERDAKWFSTEKREETPASTTLVEAIQRGMVQMTGLVSEACSFRDTHRRNTVDIEYAMVHPPKERRDPKDPTERYRPRSHYAVVEAPTGFDVVNEAGVPVARFGGREKGKATQHAAALNRGRAPEGTEPVPSDPPPPSEGSVDDRFEEAMRTAGPGSWGRLTMMYASPQDVARPHRARALARQVRADGRDARLLRRLPAPEPARARRGARPPARHARHSRSAALVVRRPLRRRLRPAARPVVRQPAHRRQPRRHARRRRASAPTR